MQFRILYLHGMSWSGNLLKFYYFSLLYHYRKRGENYVPSFSSVLLMELTAMSLVSFVILLIDPTFFQGALRSIGRLYWLIFNIIMLIILYQIFGRQSKSTKIFEMFIVHEWNTKTNRMLCWLFWTISFLAPITLATIRKVME